MKWLMINDKWLIIVNCCYCRWWRTKGNVQSWKYITYKWRCFTSSWSNCNSSWLCGHILWVRRCGCSSDSAISWHQRQTHCIGRRERSGSRSGSSKFRWMGRNECKLKKKLIILPCHKSSWLITHLLCSKSLFWLWRWCHIHIHTYQSGGFILPNILQSIQIQIISAFECSCKIESLQQDVTEK